MEKEEKEIDLLELGKKLWDNKKFIIKCSIIGAIVGLVVAFSIPKEYTTTVVLTTDSGKTPGGNMGVLASMAGINLGANTANDIFSPELYPEVLNSTPFVQGLLQITISDTKQNINTTLHDFFKEEYKEPWWKHIINSPKYLVTFLTPNNTEVTQEVDNKYFISREDLRVIERLNNSYSINTDNKTGITKIEVTTQSPKVTAYLADTITSYLQTYIIKYRTKKATTDLENSKKLYDKARSDYYIAQQNLANFVDGNINVVSAKYRINQERLQNETNLMYSVYNQMAQQMQINIIKIQDDTPVFTIIQPSFEPISPSKPSKLLILIAVFFITIVSASAWVLRHSLVEILSN